MGWFEQQIRERREYDDACYNAALEGIRAAVRNRRASFDVEDSVKANDALAHILNYYGATPNTKAPVDKDIASFLSQSLQTTGIMFREVRLTPGWQKDACFAMLGFLKDGSPVALIPSGRSYCYVDNNSGKLIKLTPALAEELTGEAYCFYRPLPLEKLDIRSIVRYMLETLDTADYVKVALALLAATGFGMLLPLLNEFIFSNVVIGNSTSILLPVALLLISVTLCQLVFGAIRAIVADSLGTKISLTVEAACMMRVLSLPSSFFREHKTGSINAQVSNVKFIADQLQELLFGSSLTVLCTLIYIGQMFSYAPSLMLPALLVVLLSVIVSVGLSFANDNAETALLNSTAALESWEISMLGGIQKIKLAGAEERAFATWAKRYADQARCLYGSPGPAIAINPLLSLIMLGGTIMIYAVALNSGVATSEYIAFTTAFALITTSLNSFSAAISKLSQLPPVLRFVEPILQAVPETSEGKQRVDRLNGKVDIEALSFAYPGQRELFEDLNISIRPGQYVGIVGRTGCGKSTLVRLLLGFEKPQRGVISYDAKDMANLDLSSLRQRIGVVMQGDSLFEGDIYSNIALNVPDLSLEQAWEVAEQVGLAEDIRNMPMGMQTLVHDGSGAISGGQKQRLLIARAIAPKPKILIFDEATSALDNITQAQVSESLAKLKCTRIVIAHRLSTIKDCDRILVLDKGRIVQEGKFDALMEDKDGLFVQLVSRQRA